MTRHQHYLFSTSAIMGTMHSAPAAIYMGARMAQARAERELSQMTGVATGTTELPSSVIVQAQAG